MSFRPAYVPIGVGTFHLESARNEFDKSISLLRSIDSGFSVPDDMLLSIDKLEAYLDGLNPDFIIVQNLTFANAAYIYEVLRRFDCPLAIWTLREPVIDGTRLRLNSLTGAYSAANAACAFGRKFEYVFGSPDEKQVQRKIKAVFACVKVMKIGRAHV